MMRWVVSSSLKFPSLVIAIAVGVMVLGITQLPKASLDVLPEFMPPTVEVQTEALGLSAEEVEQMVTVPLEQDLLNGVAFVDEIESVSLPGLSSIVLSFEPGTDLLDARQVVGERLTQAVGVAGLPQVAKLPQMLQPLSSASRVAMVKLSSDERSLIDMSVLARWVITPRLLGVDGVANVAIWGFRDRQLQVLVDPARLAERGVTLNDIIRTTGNALEVSPLSFLEASSPGTGGFIDTANQRLHIFHEAALSTPDELAQVTIEDTDGEAVFIDGEPLALGAVTEIVEDHQPLIGDALCGDGQCLLLVIEKFPEANTVEVTNGVDAALAAMRPGLSGIEIDNSIYRPARYIASSFINLGTALAAGMALLVLVLGAFFFRWRTVVISVVAVCLSLVTAGLLLYVRGVPVNMITMAGIVLALGAVIGDAVIDVENAVRRLRQRSPEGAGLPRGAIIREATLETRRALLFSTFIVVLALVPVFFLDGEIGAFLPSLALSYLLAIAASMTVAVTVVPALGMLLLGEAPINHREFPVAGWLHRRYDRMTSGALNRPRWAFIALGASVVAGLIALPFMSVSISPRLKERDLLIRQTAPAGTSLVRMNEITGAIVDELVALQGIREVGAHVGRAVTSDQIVNVNSSEIWVSIDPDADYEATMTAIEGLADSHPEVQSEVLTYSQQRVTTVLSQAEEDVMVRIYGQDYAVLGVQAEEVRALLAGIEGIDQPKVEFPEQEQAIEIKVDLARAQAVGIKPGDVRRAAAVLFSGITVGNLFEDQKVFDVVVWGRPEIRQDEADIRNLMIDAPDGGHVRLGDVAEVRTLLSPAAIRHESVFRYADVTASVVGRPAGGVLGNVKGALAQMEFPYEYHAQAFSGLVAAGLAWGRVISLMAAVAIGIFLLLQAATGSWRLAVLAFLTLPMALAGGVVAAMVDGGTLGMGAIAGLIAILGIAARNGILMIRHFQELERREGRIFGPELVKQGADDLLMPIVLTAVATAVALIPIVLMGEVAGLELVRPLVVVMLGGLLTSTTLALLVMPALYLRFGFVAAPDLSAEELVIDLTDVDVEVKR